MEAFAIASVCEYHKVPFAAVKYVSDKVGENNLKIWEETLANARKGLADFFSSIM
jgi:nucleoside phosphorylase